jgi:hypothetical protein
MIIRVPVMIQHEDTKGTKDHKAAPPRTFYGGVGGASCIFVFFVPSW